MGAKRALIYHNLAVLLEAGLPVKKTFDTVASGLRGRFANDLRALNDAISRGATIAEAMASRPGSFSPMDVMIVRAGETSGMVAQAVQGLADWYGFCAKLRRDFIAGMGYPMFVVHASAFLVPLPWLFLGRYTLLGYLLTVLRSLGGLYLLAGAIWALRRFARPMGLVRRTLDGVAMKIPVLRRALMHLALGRFCRVFHMLYTAGVPIQRALSQSIDVCGNAVVGSWLEGANRAVRSGNAASEGFSHRLPRGFVAAWTNGEVSGQLDVIADHLANMEGDAAHFQLSQLAQWAPRIIYFLIVMYLAAAIVILAKGIMTAPLMLEP
ncbi:MAG: type II secretion system F family protein [Phycisphaerae bacterium]|nr:type II secretion system F family protein [Phycisphaerae bacterium]